MNPIAELHKTVDTINARLANASADKGSPVTCRGKGCCHCCYEPVYCSSDEAHYLVEALTTEQRAAVTGRLQLALNKARESGLFEKNMPPVMEWLALKLPCPFLENGQCSVYDRRPVSCRSHMAVGDPDWCGNEKRLQQKYPEAKEVSAACGQAIIHYHLQLGNVLHHDNLLALLENELLGEYHETASAQMIVFETETTDNQRTESD